MSQLVEKAEQIAKQAYAPYSNYLVGAVARMNDGTEFVGTNVENAAYPLTQCAEKTAIGAAALPGIAPATSTWSRSARRRAGGAASGCMSGGCRASSIAGRTARSRRRAPPTCCRTAGTCPDEVGLRRGRRPAERRQVDTRQRADRHEGRDRLRQAAHDAAPHPRCAHERRRPARPRRPAGLAEARRHDDRADAGHRRRHDKARTSTPYCSSSTLASESERATDTSRAASSRSACLS